MREPASRPIGITIIAVLLALNGVASILMAVGIGTAGPVDPVSAVFSVLFGLALLYLAYGMWTLQGWAWLATLIIQGLNALFAIIALFLAPGAVGIWISLILAVAIIVYLIQPGVRSAFGRPAGT